MSPQLFWMTAPSNSRGTVYVCEARALGTTLRDCRTPAEPCGARALEAPRKKNGRVAFVSAGVRHGVVGRRVERRVG